jgi:hypothetical protein
MVGTGRFELPTPRTPSECSTRLSHVPTGRIPPLTKEPCHPAEGFSAILHHSTMGAVSVRHTRIRPVGVEPHDQIFANVGADGRTHPPATGAKGRPHVNGVVRRWSSVHPQPFLSQPSLATPDGCFRHHTITPDPSSFFQLPFPPAAGRPIHVRAPCARERAAA